MQNLSIKQHEVIARLRESSNGRIVRFLGGFWRDTPGADWHCNIQTIRSLERLGWLERTHEREEEWGDPRRLTVRAAAALRQEAR